ncbi:MAG: hypothetical protein QM673_00245 [Gordonia sp. (in: high G+C Gram-positive bacteria)]
MSIDTVGGPSPIRKLIAVILGTGALLALLIVLFALPAARSAPHHIPVGVVAAEDVEATLREHAGSAIDFTKYRSADAARAAILHRKVYGAVVISTRGEVTNLVATAASASVATIVESIGQQVAATTGGHATTIDVRGFPAKDPHGAGLAAGALPLALGGWISAMVIMLVIHRPGARVVAAVGVAVVGGLAVVAIEQFVVATFDGNYLLTSLAAMLGIAATCFAVLGLRELLGGLGIGIAAIALILLGNPLSGLASAPEMLPRPWGAFGQLLPPGATGALLRDVTFFDGHGLRHPIVVLICWLIGGIVLYILGVSRNRRARYPVQHAP